MNFNQWIYGAYCGMIMTYILVGKPLLAIIPLIFLLAYSAYDYLINKFVLTGDEE